MSQRDDDELISEVRNLNRELRGLRGQVRGVKNVVDWILVFLISYAAAYILSALADRLGLIV